MSEFRMMAYAANLGRDNITYPGLIAAWSAKGKTNDDEDRAILKDLTGNGHDITLNNFAFSEMSGYGGYNIKPFTKWYNKNSFATVVNSTTVKIPKVNNPWDFAFSSAEYPKTPIIFKVKSDIDCTAAIHFKCKKEGSSSVTVYEQFSLTLKANIITPITIYSDAKVPENCTFSSVICFFIAETLADGKKLTIELIPEYPDALVFDGVNDYGINKRMPIVDDYTFIIKRLLLKDSGGVSIFGNFYWNNSSKDYFWFEYNNDSHSFNSSIYIGKIRPEEISWQTKFSYNGLANFSPREIEKGNKIAIGNLGGGFNRNMAFYSAYLFDRSLNEQEIKAFIRKYIDPEYLLPSEIPTPDCYYDFSKGSNDDETRDTIKDYSGNGNDATAHNFAWNEESGYAEGRLKFDSVDDYISLDTFDSGFKTVFMLCNPLSIKRGGEFLYDQRKSNFGTDNSNYAIFTNGMLNSSVKAGELVNKKQLIHILANGEIQNGRPMIGANNNGSSYYSTMALYKFLGFKEALTEEQIQAIIKKYNLLDGVDEIEVS